MRIKSLSLVNFRNHKSKEVDFSSSLTLIIGPNGSGKTNILESLYLLSTGKSPRAVYERDLVLINENFAKLDVEVSSGDKIALVLQKKENNRIAKQYKINGVSKNLRQAIHYFNVVMFAPEDIRIVAGSPSRRRDYLDKIISAVDENYRNHLSIYEKVLRQRNSILEDMGLKDLYLRENEIRHDLEYWDFKLIDSATYIQKKRRELFEFALENLQDVSRNLFANGILILKYHENKMTQDRLNANLKADFMRKSTGIGPHRDDYEFILALKYKHGNQQSELDEFLGIIEDPDSKEFLLDLKSFGSRGQQRTAVLALKVIEMMYIKKLKFDDPVLLLDDIFSELDEDYRKLVFNITKGKQTIISSAVEVNKLDYKDAKVVRL